MKIVLVYVLLLAVMLPSISPWGTIAYYQLNKDYIARVLCENRSRPELHCDGKCYLAKQLKAQQDKQDKETTERVQNVTFIQLFCEANFRFVFAPTTQFIAEYPSLFTYTVAAIMEPLGAFFRPPRS